MFEEEIKMEERSSSVGPMLLIAAVCVTIVATAVYVAVEAHKGMSQAEAKRAVGAMLAQRGPAMLHFHTGLMTSKTDQKPADPQYALMERAQLITIEKRDNGTEVDLTEDGTRMVNHISGSTRTTAADGTTEYMVPLGTRELVSVTGVNVLSPSSATIHYTWQWKPTQMGDVFDLAGSYASGLDVWQRADLAKNGADLFHSAPVPDEYNATSGWQLARN
ncbi:MAG TPA: hypothetical protein VGL89_00880 [Candidatus Koribacter sp.]|jgi:hypothetical protein